ncbi:phage major capsid protein [Tunturiibacter gelidoferens]|uniref:HK97 family phage major capsid protein n=1 Tax=Tunturiibacter gelidiferens TaxID=3069689 RepID=A0A9X0QG91_9BACT|nr:phage major capsid protein [Edaphobacter lichenicola]MBB5329810.1 HK97 family phage major capsid protein [Edaphobacter lichenicola]
MTTPANKGVLDPELKSALDALRAGIAAAAPASKLAQLQTQVDSLDSKMANRLFGDSSFGNGSTLLKTIRENEGIQRILKDRRGTAVLHLKGSEYSELMDRKSIISSTVSGSSEGDALNPVGVSTTGVLQIDRIAGITPEARQVLRVRNVLYARPTTMTAVDFVKVTTPLSPGSPVPEASVRPENQLVFTSLSEKVRLIATWIPATKQVLDDMTELMGFIQSSLPYYINLEEELQLLAGDDTGENLHGLLPQAQAFNSGLLSATHGWTYLDVIATAIRQINAAKEIDPTFVILNTNDWWTIALTKDSLGRYILGSPQSLTTPRIFGLDVVSTTTIPQGVFLVGSSSPVACEIRDRQEMTVEISSEHADYFTRGLVAVRAEKRLALVTKRPASFCSGTFSTSPA